MVAVPGPTGVTRTFGLLRHLDGGDGHGSEDVGAVIVAVGTLGILEQISVTSDDVQLTACPPPGRPAAAAIVASTVLCTRLRELRFRLFRRVVPAVLRQPGIPLPFGVAAAVTSAAPASRPSGSRTAAHSATRRSWSSDNSAALTTIQPSHSGKRERPGRRSEEREAVLEDRFAAPLTDVMRLHRAMPDGDGAVPVFAGRVRHPGHVDRDERDGDLAVDVFDLRVVRVEVVRKRRKLRDPRQAAGGVGVGKSLPAGPGRRGGCGRRRGKRSRLGRTVGTRRRERRDHEHHESRSAEPRAASSDETRWSLHFPTPAMPLVIARHDCSFAACPGGR